MKKLVGTKNRLKLLPPVSKLAGCLGLVMACAVLYGQDVPSVPQTTPQPTSQSIPDQGDAAAIPAQQPAATPAEPDQSVVDTDIVPKQGAVTPNVDQETVASDEVYTVHLRPLFTTVVRLPEPVTSLAVGAPTLIAAEHDKAEPRLVFLKPTTHKSVDSNVIVALRSGHTLAIRVISAGDEGSSDPVDFVVDYSQPHGLMLGSGEIGTPLYPARPSVPTSPALEAAPTPRAAPGQLLPVASPLHGDDAPEQRPRHRQAGPSSVVTDDTPVATRNPPGPSKSLSLLDSLYQEQLSVAAPHYTTAEELARIYPEDKNASVDLSASLGRCVQTGDNVTLSYSVLNRSERWIEVLPPVLEFNNPSGSKKNGKVDKKHPEALAEQLPISDTRMSKTKLAPGERLDGALEFVRPGFKFRKERLLLQIANASEVDTALLVPVPFVPAGHE